MNDWVSQIRAVFPAAAIAAPVTCRPSPLLEPTPALLAPVIDAVRPGETVRVVVSDQTRKTGAAWILPLLIAGWTARGVAREAISFIVAGGSHRVPEPAEIQTILGDAVYAEFATRTQTHNAFTSPCTTLGVTRRGTPVAVNRDALAADALITIGGVTYHYFAGFTGGRKSIVPGLAASRTIAANHSLTIDPVAKSFRHGVALGQLAGNAVAEDLTEAAALVAVRASVQTVLDGQNRLIGLFAGPMAEAHAQACACARAAFSFPRNDSYDLVIAAAGTARNWVQSHKALVNAYAATAPGGQIILEAPCPEGLGSASFSRWVEKGSAEAIIAGIAESADINAQTALSTLVRGQGTILVSTLPEATVRQLGMLAARNLPQALELARARMPRTTGRPLRILPLPEAWLTVPV